MRGRGLFMIWALFSVADKSSIEFIDGTMNYIRYVRMLENMLDPLIVAKHDYDCWFEKDNATAHVADHTMEYFTEQCRF